MWNMRSGTRVLTGPEAELFRLGVSVLVTELESWPDEPVATSVQTFDRLSWGQQVTVVCEIGRGILLEDVEPIALNAANESAIAAVYAMIAAVLPVDHAEDGPVSRAALSVASTLGLSAFADFETTLRAHPSEWQLLVGCLRDRILWDDDHVDTGISDLKPSDAREVMQTMNIAEDYYTVVPGDPDVARGLRYLAILRQQCEL